MDMEKSAMLLASGLMMEIKNRHSRLVLRCFSPRAEV
jgi:hypothetical protein